MLCPAVYGDPSNMLFYCLFVCSEFQKRVLFFFPAQITPCTVVENSKPYGNFKNRAVPPKEQVTSHARATRRLTR